MKQPMGWCGLVVASVLMTAALPAAAQEDESEDAAATIILNGVVTRVRWSDGDSFRILDGEHGGHSVRLSGYNALESYGPVHSWGEWTPQELLDVSHQASDFAQTQQWTCTTDGSLDRYERVLVQCDDLTMAMVSAGLGIVFAIGTPPDPMVLSAQAQAQSQAVGMWAKGTPAAIVTSLHSADESEGSGADAETRIYNRIVSTSTGISEEVPHSDTYGICQQVCMDAAGSCMIYVPYEQRYGGERAECLR